MGNNDSRNNTEAACGDSEPTEMGA